MLPAQPFAQLRSTPAGVLLLELDDGLLDLKGELAGMPVGPSGAIRQAIQPTVLVTTEDLVAGLAGDPELPAQHRHLLPVEPTGHKPKPFVHLVSLRRTRAFGGCVTRCADASPCWVSALTRRLRSRPHAIAAPSCARRSRRAGIPPPSGAPSARAPPIRSRRSRANGWRSSPSPRR